MRIRWEWLVAAAAPVWVAVSLLWWRRLEPVFLGYHVGLGLVLPLACGWRAGDLRRRGLTAGAVLGLVFGLAPLAAWRLMPDVFPDAARLADVLTGWQLDPARPGWALVFLAVVNGPAEEVLWRSWLPSRLGTGRLTLGILAVLFTSYHAVTIGALAPSPVGVALMLGSVLGAAIFWTWTRRRFGTLWPALLTHTGATLGYLTVCQLILR